MEIIERLKDKIRKEKINDPEFKTSIKESNNGNDEGDNEESMKKSKKVMLVIGVNGVGKTTSIGKLQLKIKQKVKKYY